MLAASYRASCCRYLWTKAIAMLPSPTADATRLTGLNLTSPQAKTPGTLDSSRYGSRLCDQRLAFTTSSLVRTYPRASRAMSAGSLPVYASAPMKMNRRRQSCRRTVALVPSRMSIAVRWVSPCAATTSECNWTITFDFPPSCSIR